jgi:molecular chaperone DnaK
MARDAEAHAAEDKARRELVDLKNHSEQIVHETEKALAEHGSKLAAADKAAIESSRDALKQAAAGDDKAALQRALTEFQAKAQKLGEVLYKEQHQAHGQPPPGAAPQGGKQQSDEPVDADFEVKT